MALDIYTCSTRTALLIGASAAAFAISPVHAQVAEPEAADANQTDGLQDIIVTAQKREESSSKVGLSIVSVSGDALQQRQVTSADDLGRVVPGFTYANSAFNVPVYSIRGVGFNDNALGASPTVSVYLDQVALPYTAMTQGATLDVERLEVLKGPQGTLFGQNSTAGAINYIARKPTADFEAGGSLSYGRFDYARVEGYVSGPLSSIVRARLAASREISGDWQKSITRDDTLGSTNRGAARLLLDWDATPDLKFTLNLNGWFDKSDSQAGQLVDVEFGNAVPANQLAIVRDAPRAPKTPRAAEWTPGTDYEGDNWFYQTSLRADWSLGDFATLTSITAYNRFRTRGYSDIDGIDSENGEVGFDGSIRAFNEELRLTGDIGRLHWIVGGSIADDKIRDDQPSLRYGSSAGSQNLVGFHTLGSTVISNQTIKTKAVFGSAEYQFSDLIKVLGGVRYTKADRDFAACSKDSGDGAYVGAFTALQKIFSGGLTPNPTFTPTGCVTLGPPPDFSPGLQTAKLSEDNVSWNAGINITPTSSSLIYARVSQGYKSGSFPTLAYTLAEQVKPVTQESLLAYETGFKATLLDRRLRVEGAVFYYDYIDKQLKGKRVFVPFGPLNALQNIPKSWVKGAELSVTAQPTRGLTLNAAANYVKTKITEFSGFDAAGIFRDLAGTEFNFTPKWQIQGGIQYEWDVSSKISASLGADVIHRSGATGVIGPFTAAGAFDHRYDIPAYTLLDLRASLGTINDRWRLSIWGKNVTNEYFVTNALRDVDTIVRFTGRPATYGATLAVKI
jgi:iron complex outermembrane receptor protein